MNQIVLIKEETKMEDKKMLNLEDLDNVTGGTDSMMGVRCPKCQSTAVIPVTEYDEKTKESIVTGFKCQKCQETFEYSYTNNGRWQTV